MAASSSVPFRKKLYDVFISFRGENTRRSFISHLYYAFLHKKIKVYIDEESLKKGDEISPALMKAIQESKISVVILSENYATSSWCLEELSHILHCKEIDKQIVIPIFYNVEPSNVRHQKESYATAFTAHEKRFCDKMDKVQKWKNALTTVSNLSGFRSSSATGSDSKLVEAIVKDVMGKLNCLSPGNNLKEKDLVGMDKRIEQFQSLLNNGSQEVRIVGIWGIGGIGKTTLARDFFHRFASQFEGCIFLENVKEESKRSGLKNLQKALFSKLLGEESSIEVNESANDRLQRTKALVVLDDVDSAGQLEYLVEQVSFGPGSKIIITTRDKQVLTCIGARDIYQVKELDFEEALQLFCSKAFRQNSPPEDYESLSRRVVEYARGLPLALEVLGSHLHSKSPESWESALNKLKKCPNKEIHKVLSISYDEQQPESPNISSDTKSKKLPVEDKYFPASRNLVTRIQAIQATNFRTIVQQFMGNSGSDDISSTGTLASDDISSTVTLASFMKTSSSGRERTISYEMVLQWLDDPLVSMIGIYGMGGVGKTAVALQIQNQLRNHPNHSVSWVTASQNFSIRKLQDDMASTLNIDLSDEDDEEKRVKTLSTALEEKNVVLILDGLLSPISLEDVGITTIGCKLIFTTRSFEVCQMMNCHKVIRLGCLSDEEGWELFRQKIGPGIRLPHSIDQIAKSIVKECSGLPLAIVTMAANMKGVEDFGEWSSALNRIKENRLLQDDDDVDSSTNEIYRVLQYCYDKLKDPIVQQCLLYCQSYPQEFKIDREMLIENLIDAGLVDGKNREAEFNNGDALLDKLENAFLLEGGPCKYGKRYVKMNNLVREFLLSLSSSKLPSEFRKKIPEDDGQIDEHQLVVMPEAGEVVTVSADPDE